MRGVVVKRSVERERPLVRRGVSAALAVAVLSASLGSTSFALAQAKAAEPSKDTKKEAGKHFKKGKDLFEKKDYKAAKEAFLQADTILPAGTSQYYIARCAEENGDDADAVSWYQKAIDSGTLKDDQATDAKTRLAALKKKIEASKPPEPKPETPPPATPAATTTATVTTDTSSGKKDMTWVYVTGGAAVVALGVGTFFGLAALKNKNDFNEAPTKDARDTGNRNALIADISIGVGVTFGIAAAVLFLSKPTETPAATASKHTAPVFAPIVGLPTGKGAPSMAGVAALFRF